MSWIYFKVGLSQFLTGRNNEFLKFSIEKWVVENTVGIDVNQNHRSGLVFPAKALESITIAIDKHSKDITKILIFFNRCDKNKRKFKNNIVYFLFIAVDDEMLIVFKRSQNGGQKERTQRWGALAFADKDDGFLHEHSSNEK